MINRLLRESVFLYWKSASRLWALDSGTWHMLVDVCGSMRLSPSVFPRTGDENGIDLITEVRSEAISAHSVVIVVALTGSGKSTRDTCFVETHGLLKHMFCWNTCFVWFDHG